VWDNQNSILVNTSQTVDMVSAYNGNEWSGLDRNQRIAYFIRMMYCFFTGEDFSYFLSNEKCSEKGVMPEILQQDNCLFDKMFYVGVRLNGHYYLRKNLVFKFIKEMSDITLISINAPMDVYFHDLLDSGVIDSGFGLRDIQGVPMPNAEYFTISEEAMEKIINPPNPLQYV